MKLFLTIFLFACSLDISFGQVDSTRADAGADSLVIIDSFLSSPEVLYKPEIIFPKELLSFSKQARVYIELSLDTLGVTSNFKVLKASDSRFNKHALKYAKLFRFAPLMQGGKRIAARIAIPIIFTQ